MSTAGLNTLASATAAGKPAASLYTWTKPPVANRLRAPVTAASMVSAVPTPFQDKIRAVQERTTMQSPSLIAPDPNSISLPALSLESTMKSLNTRDGKKSFNVFDASVIVLPSGIEAKLAEGSVAGIFGPDKETGGLRFLKSTHVSGDLAKPVLKRVTPIFDPATGARATEDRIELIPQDESALKDVDKRIDDERALLAKEKLLNPTKPVGTVELVYLSQHHLDISGDTSPWTQIAGGDLLYHSSKSSIPATLPPCTLVSIRGLGVECYLANASATLGENELHDPHGRVVRTKFKTTSTVTDPTLHNHLELEGRMRSFLNPHDTHMRKHTGRSTYFLKSSPYVVEPDFSDPTVTRQVVFTPSYQRSIQNENNRVTRPDEFASFALEKKGSITMMQPIFPVAGFVNEYEKVILPSGEADLKVTTTEVRSILWDDQCRNSGIAGLTSWGNVNTDLPLPYYAVFKLKKEKDGDGILPSPDTESIDLACVLVGFDTKRYVMENGVPVTLEFIKKAVLREGEKNAINQFNMQVELGEVERKEGENWKLNRVKNLMNETRGKKDFYNITEGDGDVHHLLDPANGWRFSIVAVSCNLDKAKWSEETAEKFNGILTNLRSKQTPEEGTAAFTDVLKQHDSLRSSFFANTARDLQFIVFAFKPDEMLWPAEICNVPYYEAIKRTKAPTPDAAPPQSKAPVVDTQAVPPPPPQATTPLLFPQIPAQDAPQAPAQDAMELEQAPVPKVLERIKRKRQDDSEESSAADEESKPKKKEKRARTGTHKKHD